MSLYIPVVSYSVETATQFVPRLTKQEAESTYNELVKENIHCEFFREGILEKEHKPTEIDNGIDGERNKEIPV